MGFTAGYAPARRSAELGRTQNDPVCSIQLAIAAQRDGLQIGSQATVLMPGGGLVILKNMEIGGCSDSGVCAAVDVHYLSTGGARAAAVLTADAAFAHVLAERTAVVPWVAPYRPGEFYLRELPPLRAVLEDLSGLDLLVVDGYVDLDPGGRPGLGAYANAEFGIPVIGVAKSRFPTATHAVPVVRGSSARPLFVTATGMHSLDAADLVRRMTGRYRLPDALRRADTLARTGPPAATMTGRQPE